MTENLTGSHYLERNPNKSTFVPSEELARVPPGFHGEAVNFILFLNFSRVSGGGITKRLLRTINGMDETLGDNHIPFGYVGYSLSSPLPEIVSTLSMSQEKVSVEQRKEYAKNATKEALEQIRKEQTIGVICTANTGFTLWALQEAAKESKRNLKFIYIGGESTFSINSEPSDEPQEERRQDDLIYRKNYKSSKEIQTHMAVLSPGYIDPHKISGGFAPHSTYCYTTSVPMERHAINEAINLQQKEKYYLAQKVTDLLISRGYKNLAASLLMQNIRHIHTAANNGLWDPNNIGTWWTQEQYEDILKASYNMGMALSKLSERLATTKQEKIVFTSVPKLINYTKRLKLSHIYSIDQLSTNSPFGIYLSDYPHLPEEDYLTMLAYQDIVFNRTTQANAYTSSYWPEQKI